MSCKQAAASTGSGLQAVLTPPAPQPAALIKTLHKISGGRGGGRGAGGGGGRGGLAGIQWVSGAPRAWLLSVH